MAQTSFKQLLATHGYSTTKARTTVYALLARSEPLSMHQIISALPGIDRSSVYRTLALFEKLGITQRLQIGWKYKIELSNEYQAHHHHASCLQCGKIYELPEDTLIEKQLHALTAAFDFTAQDHQLEISGICKACKKGIKT